MAEDKKEEFVFHKKLKVKLKKPGDEGKAEFLTGYLNYIILGKKTLPPDFPSFVREILGQDIREGFLHIRIWHEESELVDFAQKDNYEYKIDNFD